jgi:hypothetical protein
MSADAFEGGTTTDFAPATPPKAATLTLRNPSDKPQEITINAHSAFELPKGAKKHFAMKSPYQDQRIKSVKLDGNSKVTIGFKPFEVLVFEGEGKRF